MGNLDRLHFCSVDARPDGVAVFAQGPVLVAFFVKNHGTRLADQLQAALGAGEKFKILLAGQMALLLIRAKGKAVKEFLAAGGAGLGGPFGERAGQVAGDGSPDLRDFDDLVVERVHQVNSQLLPAAALVAFEDHMGS